MQNLAPSGPRPRLRYILIAAWALLWFGLHAEPAVPAEDGHTPWRFKFTAGHYGTQDQTSANDLNLRATHGDSTWWIATYKRAGEFEQQRTGWEKNFGFNGGQLTSSLQLASHGFAGGSFSAQIGDDTLYGMLGWGRTNLKDYYNLNFDPNDAVTLGFGGRLLEQSRYTLFTVKDDRLRTGQQISHAVLRMPAGPDARWTMDYAYKNGRSAEDAPVVRGDSLAVTLDYRDVFLRITKDKKVNFTLNDQVRVALGWRF